MSGQRKFFIFAVIFFFSWQGFAQNKDERIRFYLEKQNDTIGEYVVSHNPLIASRFALPEMVFGYSLMPEQQLLFLQLRKLSRDGFYRNRGYIMVFDLEAGIGRWVRRTDFSRSNISIEGEHIIKRRAFDTYDFSPKYGEIRWHLKYSVPYANGRYGLALMRKRTKLYAFNMLNKRILWKRKIPDTGEKGRLFARNDKSLLLYSGGFYKLRVEDGEGWYLNQSMTFPDPKQDFFVFSSKKNLLPAKDLQALVLEDSSYYFVSGNKVVAVSSTGGIRWKTSFRSGKSGHLFSLSKEGDSLIVINLYDKRNAKSASPFVAIYHKGNGDEIFFKQFAPEEKLLDVKAGGEVLYCLFQDKVAAYSIANGNEAFSFQLPQYAENLPVSFTDNEVYRISGDYAPWKKLNGEAVIKILFENANVLLLDMQLHPMEQQEKYALSVRSNEVMDLVFKGDNYYILNKNGVVQAKIDLVCPATLLGNKLILMQQSYLYVMDVFVDR